MLLENGCWAFLKDFRRDYHLKKSLALRQSSMLRREKVRKNQMKVHLAQIEQDRSPKKRSSHIPLLALVNDVKEEISSLYKKPELQHLCHAYKVRYLTSWNKAKLAAALVHAIPTYDHIPHHQITSTYTVETVETRATDEGRQIPLLRLRRL